MKVPTGPLLSTVPPVDGGKLFTEKVSSKNGGFTFVQPRNINRHGGGAQDKQLSLLNADVHKI